MSLTYLPHFVSSQELAMTINLEQVSYDDYCAGHCWYYKLGGPVLYPKAILASVIETGYRGYAFADIQSANLKKASARIDALKTLYAQFLDDVQGDINKYRWCALQLHKRRKQYGLIDTTETSAHSVHVAISLKHNHIYNNLAHLHYINELLSEQPDLFGL